MVIKNLRGCWLILGFHDILDINTIFEFPNEDDPSVPFLNKGLHDDDNVFLFKSKENVQKLNRYLYL